MRSKPLTVCDETMPETERCERSGFEDDLGVIVDTGH